jgi:Tol biopolymer transport system component
LTSDFARDRAPRWSVDGRGIFFYSDRARYALWRIEADGSGLRQLTTGTERYYPVPTRDGLHLAAVDLNARQLYVYDANDLSKPPEVLPPFPDPIPTAYPQPTDWSPDGRSLLLSSIGGGAVWMYSRDTHSYRRLIDSGGAGTWLGDGRRIVYPSRGRLFITEVASPSGREILAASGELLSYPRITADGSQLFFVSGKSDGDVWTVRFGDQK